MSLRLTRRFRCSLELSKLKNLRTLFFVNLKLLVDLFNAVLFAAELTAFGVVFGGWTRAGRSWF